MRRAIRAAVKDATGPIVVVCGAWHVPAAPSNSERSERWRTRARGEGGPTVTRMRRCCVGCPKVKVAAAWVPWTHRRLSTASGYASGVSSPGWYRHVFSHPGAPGVARFFVEIAGLLRRAGLGASPDDLIAGTRLADALAALRGRPRPGLSEVLDAADAVMGNVALVRRELVVGDAIGSVPAAAPQVPLAHDVTRLQKSARLRPTAEPTTIECDLRTPNGHRRSILLHRLLALGVAWGTVEEGRGSSGTFPRDVATGVGARAVDPPHRAGGLRDDARSGGHGAHRRARHAGRWHHRTDRTPRPGAAGPTPRRDPAGPARSRPSGGARHRHRPRDGRVGSARQCVALRRRPRHRRRIVARSLRRVRRTDPGRRGRLGRHRSTTSPRPRRRAPVGCAGRARDGRPPGPATSGSRACSPRSRGVGRTVSSPDGRPGCSHDSGDWSADRRRTAALAGALSPGTSAPEGAAFVEGFLAGSGTVLVHDAELLAIVDSWLASLTGEAFDGVVALLRRTFGAFEPAERRQIMTLLVTGRPVRIGDVRRRRRRRAGGGRAA